MADNNAVRDGFVRQRRSLVATTLALLAFQGLGATLQQITVLGNTIELPQPLNVATPLWVAWLYFFVRYYQYFRDLDDGGLREAIKRRIERIVLHRTTEKIKDDTRKSLPADEWRRPRITLDNEKFKITQEPLGFWHVRVTEGTITIDERDKPDRSEVRMIGTPGHDLGLWRPRGGRLRAAIWVVLHTRCGTEYVLPFVLGVLPLLMALWKLVS